MKQIIVIGKKFSKRYKKFSGCSNLLPIVESALKLSLFFVVVGVFLTGRVTLSPVCWTGQDHGCECLQRQHIVSETVLRTQSGYTFKNVATDAEMILVMVYSYYIVIIFDNDL